MLKKYLGKFIVFEGLDGSGSSTQVERLANNLRKLGHNAFTTKEPTNNIVGGLIRGVLTHQWKMPSDGLQLLFTADRAHHLTWEIVPILERGDIVISDRYKFSNLAFGSVDLPLGWLKKINSRFPVPYLTFFVRVEPKECLRRIGKVRNGFEFFEEEKKLTKTLATYDKLAKDKSNNIVIIDGSKTIKEIEEEILNIAKKKLNL